MNTPTSATSNSRQETLEQFSPQLHSSGTGKTGRKKRSKFAHISSDCNGVTGSLKPKSGKKPDAMAAKITRPCSECGKRFWSWKALFGHMRCHPERQWRGINPPPNFRRSVLEEGPNPSPTTKFTSEDHAVATYLVLLANGTTADMSQIWTEQSLPNSVDSFGEPSGTADAETAQLEPLNCQFECTSCKKVFGSHQALGGHRASHKNVKGCFAIARSDGEDEDTNCNESENLGDGGATEGRYDEGEKMVMVLGHKCSICLRVFSSGQALGGHKRCHWEKVDEQGVSSSSTTRGCVWDLNMPAPNENENSSDLVLDLRLGI